ncbi:MAG TPA: DUF4173 domain-containing protein [Patescibacteria group bacterium]|nr:DUF4173 domain-containing protein [Patescibacteria group bacterium]
MTGSLARRLLALALVVGVATDFLVRGNALGVNVLLSLALLLAAGALAAGPARIRRVDRLDAWLAPAALASAAFVAIRADPALVAVNVLGAVILGGAALASLGGRALLRSDAGAIAAGAGEMAVAGLLGAVPVLGALRPAPGARPRRVLPGWVGPLVRGMVLATPLLLVFGALFAAGDAVFAAAAGRVLEIPFRLPLAELAERTVAVVIVSWVVAGLLLVAAGLRAPAFPPAAPVPFAAAALEAAPSGDTAVPGLERGGVLRIGQAEALVVLLAVDLLFAAFVTLQVAYLFGGLDTLAAAGLTYADYARRGFFELLAAAALAASVVATLDARVRRRSPAFLAAAVGLVALTGVTLVSSFLRLRLYQDAYGWTELRFWVLLSIGWLAVALLALAALIVLGRSGRLLHVLGVLGVVAVLAANAIGPQGFVASRNLERALDPALIPSGGRAGLDEAYLATLGDDAVPAMVAALPGLPEEDARAVRVHLQVRRRELATDPALAGWPAWNLAREQARAALATLDAAR